MASEGLYEEECWERLAGVLRRVPQAKAVAAVLRMRELPLKAIADLLGVGAMTACRWVQEVGRLAGEEVPEGKALLDGQGVGRATRSMADAAGRLDALAWAAGLEG